MWANSSYEAHPLDATTGAAEMTGIYEYWAEMALHSAQAQRAIEGWLG